MPDLGSLEKEYMELTIDELEEIRKTAVLSSDVKDILLEVIRQKKSRGERPGYSNEEKKQMYQQLLSTKLRNALATRDFSTLEPSEINYLTRDMVLTTESSPIGLPIAERLGIVTAECVYGMNVFRDLMAGLTDFFGGRSKTAEKVLRDARNTCVMEIKKEALLLGADGIVGLRLDYEEMSGGGKLGMLLLVANGTAVKLKKYSPTS